MIDVWLIPFIEVVLLTLAECRREGDGRGEEQPGSTSGVDQGTPSNVQQCEGEGEEVTTISGQDDVASKPEFPKVPVEAWKPKEVEKT